MLDPTVLDATTPVPPAPDPTSTPTGDELVLSHLWLAERVIRRFLYCGESRDDLLQVARTGLVEAARRYQPARGDFPAYAASTMTGVLKHHFRDHGWTVRPPRQTQELAQRVRHQWSAVAQATGTVPTAGTLADRLGESVSAVQEAQQANHAYRAARMDVVIEAGWYAESESAADSFRRVEARLEVRRLLAELDDADARLLSLRFVDQFTQTEIAEQLGGSQMQISRRLSRLLGRLRERLGEPTEAVLAPAA